MSDRTRSLPDARVRLWLKSVLPSWSGEGILSDTGAAELCRRYELDSVQTTRARQIKFIIVVVSLIGAVMLGMGAILFFAANWDKVTPMEKVILILLGIAAAYLVGYEFRFGAWKMPILGEALILVGSLFYGAGIWLVAQIFNIQEHYPNGVLLWGLGILPVAAILPSMVVTALASLLFLLYFGLECWTVSWPNYLYLCLVAAMFWPAYKFKSRLLVFINYLGLTAWSIASFIVLEPASPAIGPSLCLIVFSGIAALLLGRMHAASGDEDIRALAPTYFFLGFWGVSAPLYVMTFGSLVELIKPGFASGQAVAIFSAGVGFFAVIAVVAALGLVWRERAQSAPYLALVEAGLFIVVAAAALLALVFKGFLMREMHLDASRIALLFNVLLAIVLMEMIIVGAMRESKGLSGLGTFGIVVLLGSRYFDMFWGLMSRSQFFMIGGVLLLAVAWIMERLRRGVAAAAKEVSHA